MPQRLKYRRKPNSGPMHIIPREGSPKQRQRNMKIYVPGSTIIVTDRQQLPGYPHSIDGWEYVGPVNEPEEIGKPDPALAVLKSTHVGGGRYRVTVEVPGANFPGIGRNEPAHEGTLTQKGAEHLVATGNYPPDGIDDEA